MRQSNISRRKGTAEDLLNWHGLRKEERKEALDKAAEEARETGKVLETDMTSDRTVPLARSGAFAEILSNRSSGLMYQTRPAIV